MFTSNKHLFRVAIAMLNRGKSSEEILRELLKENKIGRAHV